MTFTMVAVLAALVVIVALGTVVLGILVFRMQTLMHQLQSQLNDLTQLSDVAQRTPPAQTGNRSVPPRQAEPAVITRLGDPAAATAPQAPARLSSVSPVSGPLIKLAAFGYAVRRALDEEQRMRLTYAFRKELRRQQKLRRQQRRRRPARTAAEGWRS